MTENRVKVSAYNSGAFPVANARQPDGADGNAIIWRDFETSLKNRKRLINHIRKISTDEATTAGTLKRLLLEVRQLSLTMIEDILEIEYKAQLTEKTKPKQDINKLSGLPQISSFDAVKDPEILNAVMEMVSDMDDIPKLPSIKILLPAEFPTLRNPFLLGKTVDELADLDIVSPEPGNIDSETKMLELLRYKRAANALLRIERQVQNRMPLSLKDIERLWFRMYDDFNVNILLRTVSVILSNTTDTTPIEPGAEMRHLTDMSLHITPEEFLQLLNKFYENNLRNIPYTLRVDMQATLRKTLRNCFLTTLQDHTSQFLIEWLHVVLGPGLFADDSSEKKKRKPRKNNGSNVIDNEDSNNDKKINENGEDMGESASDDNEKNGNGEHTSAEKQTKKPKRTVMHKGRHGNDPSVSSGLLHPLRKTQPDKEKEGSHGGGQPKQHLQHDQLELNAMRYELLKLQQELLRRGVLDPRHYHAASIDKVVQMETAKRNREAESGSTAKRGALDSSDYAEYANIISSGALTSQLHSLTSQLDIPLFSKAVEWTNKTGNMELVYAPLDDCIFGRVNEPGKKNCLCTMKFSKLSVNRLTGYTVEQVAEGKEKTRLHELTYLFAHMKKIVEESDKMKALIDENDNGDEKNESGAVQELPQTFYPEINRLIHKCTLGAGEVAVEVVIKRNIECTGIFVTCTPLASLQSSHSTNRSQAQMSKYLSPVTIGMQDCELQVLLINQRGLYTLAMSKWASLQVVCQWLTSRLRIKRVPIFGQSDRELTSAGGSGVLTKLVPIKESKTIHIGRQNSQDRLDDNSSRPDSVPSRATRGMDSHWEAQALLQSASGGAEFVDYSLDNTASGNFGAQSLSRRGLDSQAVLLDVTIDRSIEISDDAQTQWKSRNLPNISGMIVRLEASQSGEMLQLFITLIFPRKALSRFIEDEYGNIIDKAKVTMSSIEDSDTIEFIHQLTNVELIIFGSTEKIDEPRVHIATSGAGLHPSAFVWNVLSRMEIVFKGSKASPFSQECDVLEKENWNLQYERRLLRELRTITGGVMVVTVSAVGTEIFYEPVPSDGSIYKTVGSKLVTNAEIKEMVLSEGWPLHVLDWGRRADVAARILDKMKVINEKGFFRLELYSYPETRILAVGLMSGSGLGRADMPIGSIEINEHMTLSDLRVLIGHELDRNIVPRAYRFMYKGNPCAARQEGYRRAWETLPTVTLFARPTRGETDDKFEAKIKREERLKLLRSQRRVNKSLVPIPVPTVCRVQEESSQVATYHDIRGLLEPGDIVRIGHIKARDYIVPLSGDDAVEAEPLDRPTRGFLIEPTFDMVNEEEAPFQGNFPLRTGEKAQHLTAIPSAKKKNSNDDETSSQVSVDSTDMYFPTVTATVEFTTLADKHVNINPISSDKPIPDMLPARTETGNFWTDVWLWKCVPRSEDRRPRWRRQYDDGLIPYNFTYQERDDGPVYFRYALKWKDLENLCRDSRCPDLTIYCQRVHEMALLSTDYFMELAFNEMCKWYPAFNEFIDGNKFMKLLRDTKVFPDMKKPARQGQLEQIFQKEVKMFGMADRYATFSGFVRLIQQVALMRFPYGRANQFGDEVVLPGGKGSKNSNTKNATEKSKVSDNSRSLPNTAPRPPSKLKADRSVTSSAPGSASKLKADKSVPSTAVGSNAAANEDKSMASSIAAGSTGKMSDDKSVSTNEAGATTVVSIAGDSKITGATSVVSAGSATGSNGSNPLPAVKLKKKLKVQGGRIPKFARLYQRANSPQHVDSVYANLVYKKLVVDYLMLIPEWGKTVWEEAKLSAMNKEAIRQCASTRLAARWRGFKQRSHFLEYRRCLTILQAHVRRRITRARIEKLFTATVEDWLFRVRYYAASLVQSSVRRYIHRSRHLKILKEIREQQLEVSNVHRARLKAKHMKMRHYVLFRQMRCVSGVNVVVRIHRKDQRPYSKDYGIILDVYIPKYSETVKFTIEEVQLRLYMEDVLQTQGLSTNDLYEKRNFERLLSSRLLCRESRRAGHPPKVVFSEQPLGQKGTKAMRIGRRIGSDMFVCTLLERSADITVQCYHSLTCKIFECTIITGEMKKWVQAEYNRAKSLPSHQYVMSPLLKPENRLNLLRWLINNIVVDKRHQQYSLMFACQYRKSRKVEYILKIQALWRKSVTRKKLMHHLSQYMFLVKSLDNEGFFYYLNTKTGDTSWEKPPIFLGKELPEPSHQWVRLWYYTDREMYVNPYTGKYSPIDFFGAAKRIAAAARNYLMKPYLLPLSDFKKGFLFERNVQSDYEKNPMKLGNLINYSLLSFAIQKNDNRAKQLFIDALKLADASPLLIRLYAIFLLSTCEAPVLSSKEKALHLLRDATLRDPKALKFTTALSILKYDCIRRPTDALSLLNLGLAYFYIYSNIGMSEKCLRRAVTLGPFDERVTRNWGYVKDMFPDRNVPYLSPTLQAINVSRPVTSGISGEEALLNMAMGNASSILPTSPMSKSKIRPSLSKISKSKSQKLKLDKFRSLVNLSSAIGVLARKIDSPPENHPF